MAQNANFLPGHEYIIDAEGTKAVWGGKRGWMTPQDYQAMRGNDQASFDDKRALMGRIGRAKAKVNPFSTGWIGGVTEWIPGTPAASLKADLASLQSNEFISGTLALRQNSPTGAGVGNQSNAEGARFENRTASFDIGQPTNDMRYGLDELERAYSRRTPGLTQRNPFDLGATDPSTIPEGAYFKSYDGKIYEQRRGAGPAGNKPSPVGGAGGWAIKPVGR